jgi:hypothetical protein
MRLTSLARLVVPLRAAGNLVMVPAPIGSSVAMGWAGGGSWKRRRFRISHHPGSSSEKVSGRFSIVVTI